VVTKKRQAAKGRSSSKSRTNNIRNLHTRVMTAKGRKVSSTRWLKRQLNDPYIEGAKRDGFRSRAAYKLLQLNDRFQILKPDMKVVDLGAAPGGWSQVIVREIGSNQSGSQARLIALDISAMDPLPGAEILLHDFMSENARSVLQGALGGNVDIVLSDISPPLTGHPKTDHLRIINAVEAAYQFSRDVLHPGGCFVAKVFQGGTEKLLLNEMKKEFRTVKHAKPHASRPESSEVFVVAQNFRGKDNQH